MNDIFAFACLLVSDFGLPADFEFRISPNLTYEPNHTTHPFLRHSP